MYEEKKTTEATEGKQCVPATAAPVDGIDAALREELTKFGADEATILAITKLGVDTVEDLSVMEVDDLTGAGMLLAKARKMLSQLKDKPAVTTAAPTAATSLVNAGMPWQPEVLLPTVPSDDSWLASLKASGIRKVDESSYIAAIRALLADQAGLYNIPAALVSAMESYADAADTQVDPMYFSLRKSLTRRSYADLFDAIEGLDGSYITDARRKEFLQRIQRKLCPAIVSSYRALDGWYKTYQASFADPSALFAALGGAPGMGMNTPPDTSVLHDAGDALIDAINHVFRGTGVQIAAALAYDANRIRETLDDSHLPELIGVKNREMMLNQIGAKVSSSYVRLEQNLVKYVLGFTRHNSVTSDIETKYFIAMWQLGMQIDWAQLGVDPGVKGDGRTTSVTAITGGRIL